MFERKRDRRWQSRTASHHFKRWAIQFMFGERSGSVVEANLMHMNFKLKVFVNSRIYINTLTGEA